MASPSYLHILLALLLLPAFFYLAGPFSAPARPIHHSATADARLARFLDAVTPNRAWTGSGYTPVGSGEGGGSGDEGKSGIGVTGVRGGGKKIALWPLGEESKVMGRPGVRGGSWRSAPGVGSEDEDGDVTKVAIESGVLEAEAGAEHKHDLEQETVTESADEATEAT